MIPSRDTLQANIYVETLVCLFDKSERQSDEIAYRIDQIRQTALNYSLSGPEINVLAIRVKDLSSKKNIAYLYGTGCGDTFSLDFLFIKEASRRAGLGSILYNKAIEQAFAWKMEQMKVSTYEFQAPGFYEKLGFKRIAQIRNCINNYGLIFFEKKLPKKQKFDIPIPTHWQFEVYSESNKSNSADVKYILDKAIIGLARYNIKFLQFKDTVKREYKKFTINICDKTTNILVGAIAGLILIGNPEETFLSPDLISFKPGYQVNSEDYRAIREAVIKVTQDNKCTKIIPCESTIESELKSLGFSSDNLIPILQIENEPEL